MRSTILVQANLSVKSSLNKALDLSEPVDVVLPDPYQRKSFSKVDSLRVSWKNVLFAP